MTEQRSRSLEFEPITKIFTETSCMLSSVDVPDISRNKSVSVFMTKEKTPQNFRTTERSEVVTFIAVFIPMNNDAGKKLLSQAKNIVESVLTKDFTPSVATINTFRNGELEKTVTINDCVVKRAGIYINKDDFVRIQFEITGILASDY